VKLLREPLLHFFLAGAALFVTNAWLDRSQQTPEASDQREVRISEGHVRWITETWMRQWQREPSREELRGLIKDLLKEELLSREALELGLDQDDTIVRRRLAQKMTFLVEGTSRLAEPTEDELQQFYNAHPENFRQAARVSFGHVFFDPTRRADAVADAQQILVELAGVGEAELVVDKGDRLLVEPQMNDADPGTVAAQFGQEFALAVFELAPGAWHGPITSAYGLHLVRVFETTPAKQRSFLEVKAQVLEQWHEQQRRENEERYFAELFKKYKILTDKSVKARIGTLGADAEQVR
jgi:PPIC-type PPIASE domain